MHVPFLAAARLWVAAGSIVAATSAFADMSGPVNAPPPGFQGLQFVDQSGCLFLRAGFGAQTMWVPMIDQDRKPICGMTPTGGAPAAVAKAAPAAPEPAAAPEPVAAPPALAAAAPAVQPAAVPAKAAPAKPATIAYRTAALGGATATCPAIAPQLERVLLRSGGTALVCTLGDGTLTGWVPPVFAEGAGVGAALGYEPATAANLAGARLAGPATAAPPAPPAVAADAVPTPPKGWKLAWKDGRLNPLRGKGTVEGQAMQDRIWTRTVPAVLVAAPAPAAPAATTRVSTMSAPAPLPTAPQPVAAPQQPAPQAVSAPAGALYVQIGSFGVPANAAAAQARITALGLPAAEGHLTRGGKALQVVYAGPFADTATATAALHSLRAAGFADAFLR